MSIILKVKIKRIKTTSGTHYTYPPEYDASKIQVLCYESQGEEEVVDARGGKDEYCIGVVKNIDAPAFLTSNDIVEIEDEEALTKGRKWRPQIEKITDQNKVMQVLAKVARKEMLTEKEEDIINPDNEETGVNKSKLFDDLLTETKAKL